ncbi:glucuronate isomerase [Shimia sediminis]|uniref:glucuronate isomerase n=1 Tax=Shimia sediminis TaxID=2497945 RepID=UPI000F8C9A9E|nr:glucuronate isomerase [Shimia sediminis]
MKDRLFPQDQQTRDIARELYSHVMELPIISPHGHTDPNWFASNTAFANPAELFVTPDHYLFRMLYSQGVKLEDLGISRRDGGEIEADPRKIWRTFASHYFLFRATPTALWIDHSLQEVFGVTDRLNAKTADAIYDRIDGCLKSPEFRPRALFENFNIEVLATTESALDPLEAHKKIQASGWGGRVITTYRPDTVIDPETPGFAENIARFGEVTGEDTSSWGGYLQAHRKRRAEFKAHGATATDHGHPTARTEDLSRSDAAGLFDRALAGRLSSEEAGLFRGHMLTEMARMSIDDGLVMQLHPGSVRNHNAAVFSTFGRDKGFDIPSRTDFVNDLRPLLNAVGDDPRLTLIVFTLDEAAYGRELAPLAGAYPALKLGPAWWFFDSPEGMRRFREITTETAGFYNTVGFNDDTRAFCSIPARHDVARRVDCSYLASLVATGRLSEVDASEVAVDLTYRLAKQAYRL